MTTAPAVLGLTIEEAGRRLEEAGFPPPEVRLSGRRREGTPRVIRVKVTEGKPELVASYFKNLE